MKDFLKYLSRIFVGLTFIFSGFVKAVDPFGGAVKFQDYFIAFGFEWLTSIALPFSFLLIIFEFALGFYLVFGIYVRQTSLVAFLTMSFFTILTLILAIFNPVTDCGCFGDAIILTNWQTFWKNIVIILPTIYLFLNRDKFDEIENKLFKYFVIIAPVIYILSLSIYSHRHLPILDFRPYKTGVNLADGMSIPDDAEQPEYETLFTLSKDGIEQIFKIEEYPYDDSTWVFVSSDTKLISEGYTPPLNDFSVLNRYQDDFTSEIANSEGSQIVLLSPDINKISAKLAYNIFELSESSKEQNIPFRFITSSSLEEIEKFETSSNIVIDDYLFADEVTIKTIIRSNPGLLVIHDGTIVGKYHFNDFPTTEIIKNPLAFSLTNDKTRTNKTIIWMHIFALLFISTIIINLFKTIKTTK